MRAGLSLPLLATMSGGVTPPGYCPPCLDLWQQRSTDELRAGVHAACRALLEAIHAAPPAARDDNQEAAA